MTVTVDILRLPHAAGLPLPAYQTAGAAGLDLLAAVDEPVTLAPLARALVPTGLALALPAGHEGQVRPVRVSPPSTASPCSTAPVRSTRITAAR